MFLSLSVCVCVCVRDFQSTTNKTSLTVQLASLLLMASAIEPFACSLCHRPNQSGSQLPAGSCQTCLAGQSLCDTCSIRHSEDLPKHEFVLAMYEPGLDDSTTSLHKKGDEGAGGILRSESKNTEEDPVAECAVHEGAAAQSVSAASHEQPASISTLVDEMRALQAAIAAADAAIKKKEKVVVARTCE